MHLQHNGLPRDTSLGGHGTTSYENLRRVTDQSSVVATGLEHLVFTCKQIWYLVKIYTILNC